MTGSGFKAQYFPIDAPVLKASQFQTFRVRFRLHNAGTEPITASPRLEYRRAGASGYVVVPEKPLPGIPFHMDREWVPSLGPGAGWMQGPPSEVIPVADLRMGTESGLAMNGHHSMGANPDRPITLPSDSYTEQEFTVTLSIDAKYGTAYELRVTDGHMLLADTEVAAIRLGSPPPVRLSPGQHKGLAVAGLKPASITGAVK